MSVDGMKKVIGKAAAGDLSSFQYRIVNVGATSIASTNLTALGVLLNKPTIGQDASIAYSGHMKAVTGGAVAAGVGLKLATGGYLVVGSLEIVGKAITAASSGGLVEFIGDFSNQG